MTWNFWSFCLCLLGAGILGVYHHGLHCEGWDWRTVLNSSQPGLLCHATQAALQDSFKAKQSKAKQTSLQQNHRDWREGSASEMVPCSDREPESGSQCPCPAAGSQLPDHFCSTHIFSDTDIFKRKRRFLSLICFCLMSFTLRKNLEEEENSHSTASCLQYQTIKS